jgi:hypothetical protein
VITFNAYVPGALKSTAVNGSGAYEGADFTPTQARLYDWAASYGG